ncbi:HET-domain-containing protein, partial [Mytilinidion resinicola]
MAEQNTTQRDFPVYTDLPVGYIRILKILPGDADSDIYCHFSLVSLRKQPDYIALSYAWGSPEKEATPNTKATTTRKRKGKGKTRTIYLDGNPSFPIRKNLWRFLHQAREPASTVTDSQNAFWIDALCIDQSHPEERKQQVGSMPEIYETARIVLIWLGPSYHNSGIAMWELTRPISHWQAKKKIISVWTKPVGAAIRGLCGRPYWRRLWIFQEIMRA